MPCDCGRCSEYESNRFKRYDPLKDRGYEGCDKRTESCKSDWGKDSCKGEDSRKSDWGKDSCKGEDSRKSDWGKDSCKDGCEDGCEDKSTCGDGVLSCKTKCNTPCRCPLNYTKISDLIIQVISGRGVPGRELEAEAYLDICSGELWNSIDEGWTKMDIPRPGRKAYFYDQCKSIWKVYVSKCGEMRKVTKLSDTHCDGDIFIDSHSKTWYVLHKCKWRVKMIVENSENCLIWSNASIPSDESLPNGSVYVNFDDVSIINGSTPFSTGSTGNVHGFRPSQSGEYLISVNAAVNFGSSPDFSESSKFPGIPEILFTTGSSCSCEFAPFTAQLFRANFNDYPGVMISQARGVLNVNPSLQKTKTEIGIIADGYVSVTLTGTANFQDLSDDYFSVIFFPDSKNISLRAIILSFTIVRICDVAITTENAKLKTVQPTVQAAPTVEPVQAAPTVEPVQAEPVQAEPVQAEPVQAAPTFEPVQAVQAEPTPTFEPVQAEPTPTVEIQPTFVKVEP